MRVRRVVDGEGEQLRAIRLRALRDAPEAFGSSAEREAAYAPAVWAERAAGAETVTFVAVEGRAGSGWPRAGRTAPPCRSWACGSIPPRAAPARAARCSTPSPAGRRHAARSGSSCAVTDRAPAAAALYRAAGFVPTGEERPLPGDPPRVERVLHRSLTIR